MSRKAFLIWGLAIIQFYVMIMSIAAYLALSKVIDLKLLAPYLGLIQLFIPIAGFGALLFLRFKLIGRKKRVLAACLPFFLFSITAAAFLVAPILDFVSFADHGMMPIVYAATENESVTTWMKVRYVLLMLPAHYNTLWGLFALLWFGSLDPRTPSKNRFIQFMKTGFERKTTSALQADFREAVHG